SELHDVIGKSYNDLSPEDKKRFWILMDKQKDTLFYSNKYSREVENNYDKVQHCVSGLWIGSNYGYGAGVIVAWTIEKLDSLKATIFDMMGMRKKWQIGFDWYDYAWTVAGAALGFFLCYAEEERVKGVLASFSTREKRFDTFYTPPYFNNYGEGMGKFDPIVPFGSDSSQSKLDKSIDEMLNKL